MREKREIKFEITADGRFFEQAAGGGAGLIAAYVIAREAYAQMPASMIVARRFERRTFDDDRLPIVEAPVEVLRIATIKGQRRAWVR